MESGIAIEYGPGRHGMGFQTYLYFREPGGMRIELNSGGWRNYQPDWKPVRWSPAMGSNDFYRLNAFPQSMMEAFPPHAAGASPSANVDNPWTAASVRERISLEYPCHSRPCAALCRTFLTSRRGEGVDGRTRPIGAKIRCVSRAQRSVSSISAFTRVFDALCERCAVVPGTVTNRGGPGSAVHHSRKSAALHRIRDTVPLILAPMGTSPAMTTDTAGSTRTIGLGCDARRCDVRQSLTEPIGPHLIIRK